jgi:hypothetical protein
LRRIALVEIMETKIVLFVAIGALKDLYRTSILALIQHI